MMEAVALSELADARAEPLFGFVPSPLDIGEGKSIVIGYAPGGRI